MKKNKPILHDQMIISRVKQYLEDNVDKTYVDVDVMTKHLQEQYPEYMRRKNAAFRSLVDRAYRVVSESYGSQPSSADETDGSDLEVMDDSSSNNIVNNMMNSLYTKSKTSKATTSKQSEAIDISSDESGENSPNKDKQKIACIANMSTVRANPTNPDSSTSLNFDTMPLAGQKRAESSGDVQPPKKRKPDGNAAPQQQQQQQLTQTQTQLTHRIVNFQHNLNEAGDLTNNSQMHHQQQKQHHHQQQQQQQNPLQRQRKYKKEVHLHKSRETFQDIGGMEKTLKELCELLMHIKSPDVYFILGLMPPRGILLHGPTGCGKTLLAHAIAGQLNLPLIEVPATELIAGVSGESEERIRDVFYQATIYAPCVLFIDEIDAISSNRSMAQKDMERRIVSQLISSLDHLKTTEGGQSVLVIGATTRPDVLDPALRRVGRFDHEIGIGIPTRKDRKDILSIICDGLSIENKLDYDKIAELTPGYVGADLLALVSRSATLAVKRKYSEQIRDFKAKRNITIVDLDDDAEETTGATEKKLDDNDVSAENNQSDVTKKDDDEKKLTKEDDQQPIDDTTVKPSSSEVPLELNEKDSANAAADTTTKLTEVKDMIETVCKETAEEKSTDAGGIEKAETNESVEPTLFEMLNWLDNPPEDIVFVSDMCITIEDFYAAIKIVQPSAKREGFITVPDVTWDDIGSLQDIREELKLAVLAPVKFPEKLERLGLSAPSGVLLCGPPGCGKTLLAKAVANEAGINFISVKGPELMNMYVGESERAVRTCFQRARNSAPCVIFFDEFDSLCPKRAEGNEAGSGTRIVNQLLTEMDGVEDRQGVYILAATNRPDIIDPAILRPGRLDTILYVGLPNEADRADILKASTKNSKRPVLAEDVNFNDLAANTDGYTGADLAGLVKQAAMLALRESLNATNDNLNDLCVRKVHFDQALKMLRPSVSVQDRKVYDKLRLRYAAPRLPTTEETMESPLINNT